MTEISFGEWLKRRRKSVGLTQEQLAQQLNCSTITLRKIESEERRPSAQIVERLAEIFNISQDEQATFLRFARGDWKSAPTVESEDAPWHVSTKSTRSNLPASLTSLIGREQEIASVREYLSNPSIRLVTLIGPPGIGKTSLSLEVARKSIHDFTDGVFSVPLAPLDDPNLIAPTIIQMLDFGETKRHPAIERLKDGIGNKHMLLVLDNLEHLIEDTAPIVAELLLSCHRLKILTTSREALRVPGEWLYPVPTLTVPTETSSIDVEKASQFSALTLFAERARAVRPDFTLNTDNIQAVVNICNQLDRLPLAIELIAARIRLMSPQVLLERLSSPFTLYADGIRAVSTRQKSLYGAIAWSYDLLSEEEQKLFAYLSIFSGGFALEAVENIFSRTITNKPIFDLIASLLDKSLLQRTFDARGEPRFNMLVTIQQFALDCLQRMGEEAEVRNWHLFYFLDLSERAEPALRGPAQVQWLESLKNERDNLRAALDWAAKTKAIEAGLYLAGRLRSFWRIWNLREGEHWLVEFINSPESPHHPMALARAFYAYASILWQLQKFTEAYHAAEECLTISRACGDRLSEIDGLYLVGSVMQHLDSQESKAEIELEALALARSLGDRWRQAELLADLGWDHRDYLRARAYWEEAVTLYREVGDLNSLVDLLGALGNLELLHGDIESAQKRLDEAVQLNRQMNNQVVSGNFLAALSKIASIKGDFEKARSFLEEEIKITKESGDRMQYLWARTHLGHLALRQGNLSEARNIFVETSRNFFDDKSDIGVVVNLEGMASLHIAGNKLNQAARLIGWSDAARKKIGDSRPPLEQADVDRDIAACLAKMGEVAFSDAYDEGQRMTLEEAVTLALR